MAEDEQGVSSLPLPPMQYVNLYTDENVKRGRTPRPPPPITDTYSMFGVSMNIDDQMLRGVESQGLRRLYPHNYEHKRELRKLTHSILINFLDLLDVLVKLPESTRRAEKVDDLQLLFIHMHHLINEFRPHQARETLRVMMDMQRKQRLAIADRFQTQLTAVRDRLANTLSQLPDSAQLECDAANGTAFQVKTEGGDTKMAADDDDYSVRDQMMCDIIDTLE